MNRALASLLAGVIFGLGLSLSQMIDPARVRGFLDLSGAWDPTLALVMIGALAVNLLATRIVLRRSQPLLDQRFHLPERQGLDWQLLSGAALFGVGWGIAGYCPGPALTSLSFANSSILTLVIAYLVGTGLTQWLLKQNRRRCENVDGGKPLRH